MLGEGLSSALSLLPVTAEDLTSITYAIAGGPDVDVVAIYAVTGALSISDEPNFEAPFDANGANTFEVLVQATDEGGATISSTLTITITDQNDAPVSMDATASGDAGSVISGVLSGSDEDADILSISVVDGDDPTGGTVTITPDGAFTFTPFADFAGTDSFRFQVSDDASADEGMANITVNPADPVAPTDPTDPSGPMAPTDPMDPADPVGATGGDDTLFRTSLSDTSNALVGDDCLVGGGAYEARGGCGADQILGGGGADNVRGNCGADSLPGEGDADTLRGYGGADALISFGRTAIRVVTDYASAFDEYDFIF